MRPTRRLWATLALAGILGLLAVVFTRPLLLVGAILVGSWIASRQLSLVNAVANLDEDLTVTQTVEEPAIREDDSTATTISATIESPTPLSTTVEPGFPLVATPDSDGTLRLHGRQTEAWTTVDTHWPISGQHTFAPASISTTDDLFVETFDRGSTPTVTVEPKGIRDVHVGMGGRRLNVAYGEHKTDRSGPGIEPARVREYVAGDPSVRIDWKATARLEGVYVRDFEVETDRGTLLVIDTRATLGEGPEGETKFNHLRSVSLGLLQSARSADDPIGLLVIDEGGLRIKIPPSTNPQTHQTIRRLLLTLDPPSADSSGHRQRGTRQPIATETARRHASDLEGQRSEFATTLSAYLGVHSSHRQRIASKPLFGSVSATLPELEGAGLVAIFSDDAHLAELTETAKRSRQEGLDVLACITPGVLYRSQPTPEDAYDTYVAFEEQRRKLSAMSQITALEVGPRDRISEILAQAQRRSRPEAITT